MAENNNKITIAKMILYALDEFQNKGYHIDQQNIELIFKIVPTGLVDGYDWNSLEYILKPLIVKNKKEAKFFSKDFHSIFNISKEELEKIQKLKEKKMEKTKQLEYYLRNNYEKESKLEEKIKQIEEDLKNEESKKISIEKEKIEKFLKKKGLPKDLPDIFEKLASNQTMKDNMKQFFSDSSKCNEKHLENMLKGCSNMLKKALDDKTDITGKMKAVFEFSKLLEKLLKNKSSDLGIQRNITLEQLEQLKRQNEKEIKKHAEEEKQIEGSNGNV